MATCLDSQQPSFLLLLAHTLPVKLIRSKSIAFWILEIHEPTMLSFGLLTQHRRPAELMDLLLGLERFHQSAPSD